MLIHSFSSVKLAQMGLMIIVGIIIGVDHWKTYLLRWSPIINTNKHARNCQLSPEKEKEKNRQFHTSVAKQQRFNKSRFALRVSNFLATTEITRKQIGGKFGRVKASFRIKICKLRNLQPTYNLCRCQISITANRFVSLRSIILINRLAFLTSVD